jgi:hypothetical protein
METATDVAKPFEDPVKTSVRYLPDSTSKVIANDLDIIYHGLLRRRDDVLDQW